ncbi:MAG: neuromedin U [Myxococcales bacterium SG8_38_1]|nr:MAG: neuromedin U [Myxococcales bacterium SG8_38_1]
MKPRFEFLVFAAALVWAGLAPAQQDAASLAKAVQNPIADMVSLPFQNNTNFDVGPLNKTQNILNIQPVYPVNFTSEWNLITRTIVPVISQPAFTPAQDRENGLGDIQFSAFFSPKQPVGGWVWGAGVIAQLDTATDDRLGQGAWGLGPTAVALHLGKTWVYGALINNVWSVAKDDDRRNVNQMLLQPFVNYNFPHSPGRYLTFSPIITADWEAASGQQWTVPLGLGIGQIMRFGKQPVNLQAAAYYNVERPDNAARWQLRLQMQFLFPK